jgi:subtilisin family serine protease
VTTSNDLTYVSIQNRSSLTTLCTGIIGSQTYGVAKGVTLHSVRVLDGDGGGTYAGLIAAVDFVRMEKENNKDVKMIANLSLGGSYYSKLNDAVQSAANAGVVFIVAAGNSNVDACRISPAGASAAITVGATSNSDSRSYFSNYGPCVDLFAPGENLESLSATPGVTNIYSGTSMAAPVVSGIAAIYLQAGKSASDMLNDAIPNVITNAGSGSPNQMIYLNPDSTRTSSQTSLSGSQTLSPTMTPVTPRPTPQPTLRPTQRTRAVATSRSQCRYSRQTCQFSRECCGTLRCRWTVYGKLCR